MHAIYFLSINLLSVIYYLWMTNISIEEWNQNGWCVSEATNNMFMKCVRVIMHWRVISDCGWRMAEDCCLARPRQCLYLRHSPSSSPPPHHHPHQNSKSLPKIKNLFSCLPLYSNIPLMAIMCRYIYSMENLEKCPIFCSE